MRTKLLSIFAAAMASAALLTPTVSYAQADEAAFVKKSGGCKFPGRLVGLADGLMLTGNGTLVTTRSGESNLTCHFAIPEGLEPERVAKSWGFKCNVNGQTTTNSSAQATPGGTAMLSCKVKKS